MTAEQDAMLALARLAGVLGSVPEVRTVIALTHPGVPIPKARARLDPKHNRWYTPSTTKEAEEALAWSFVRARSGRPAPTYQDTVALVALFFVPTRQRKDLDNLLKLVMDAATKARIWTDDSQVIVQAAYLLLDATEPRTIVALSPCLNTLSAAPLLTATGAI